MGGVMLESSEWSGGLQDRQLFVSEKQQRAVDPELADWLVESGWRAGARLAPAEEVRSGDGLELVLVISGGAR